MQDKQIRIFSAVLILLLLYSCSPGVEAVETSIPAQTSRIPSSIPVIATPTISSPANQDSIRPGTEVEFWHPWSGYLANLVDELVEEFNQSNDRKISIRAIAFADEQVLMQQVADVLEENDPMPDLIAAPDFFLASLVENGVGLHNLDEYLASPVWSIPSADLERFYTVFLDSGLYAGDRISFPAYRTGHFLFYNQSWAEELGFSRPPEDPEEFEEQACAAARFNQFGSIKENIGTGGWIYSFDPNAFLSWMNAFGGGVGGTQQGEDELSLTQNNEGAVFLYDMFLPLNNCAWLGRQSLPYQYFANRQAISYSGTVEDIQTQEQVNELSGMEDIWTVVPYPPITGKPVINVSGHSYGIITQDDDKALAAWEFIKWMSTAENQAKIVETTYSFPLSAAALELLTDFLTEHPAWSDSLVYLPLAESVPTAPGWIVMRNILSDISWQLIQFTTAKEDLPEIWENARILYEEIATN